MNFNPQTTGAVLFELGRPLEVISLSLPTLKPGQVLVEVAYSGLCHSQLNEVRGRKGPDKYLPHVLGHEGSGIVMAIGEGVTKVRPGQQVVLSWLKGQGADQAGIVYGSERGAINSGAIATFMRHTVTCENRVTPVPEGIPLNVAALLGCAVPTGAGIVFNSSEVKRGESVAVFGVGGIGLSAVMAAHAAGASPIIAIDRIPEKLEKARELGATHTVHAGSSDPLTEIRALTAGQGVQVSIESSGQISVMEAAFSAVKAGGGLCVICGNASHGSKMVLDPFDLIRGKRLIGSWGGESNLDSDIPRYADLFLKGQLFLQKLISKEYALEEINQALDDLEQGKVIRGMVRM